MATLEEEIQNTLHAKPTWATTGDELMDFSISEAERQCTAAREELLHIRAEVWAGRLEADEGRSFQVTSIIDNCRATAGQHLSIVSQKIDQNEARARATISQRNEKPKATDAEIAQRWSSLTRLFDSMTAGNVINAMRSEMETSEAISRYLLRSHDGELFINAKKIDPSAFFAMIAETASLLEPDIKEAALAVVQAREQRTAIVPGWKAFSEALDELGKIAGTIFRPPNSSKPIKAQQQMDGTINISFPNMASFREWATTPRV